MSEITEVTHLTAELVKRLAASHDEGTSATLARRVLAVSDALAYGCDVKTIAADMDAEHRRDDSIPAVTAKYLGYARAVLTVAELSGTDPRAWHKREGGVDAMANAYRAAKRVGVKVFTTAVRDGLKSLPDDAGLEARSEVLGEVIESQLATVLPAKVSTPRGKGTAPEEKRETVSAEMTAAAALAAVRALTAWLGNPDRGMWSADLGSAFAELDAAAASARKRNRTAHAATTESVPVAA